MTYSAFIVVTVIAPQQALGCLNSLMRENIELDYSVSHQCLSWVARDAVVRWIYTLITIWGAARTESAISEIFNRATFNTLGLIKKIFIFEIDDFYLVLKQDRRLLTWGAVWWVQSTVEARRVTFSAGLILLVILIGTLRDASLNHIYIVGYFKEESW